MNNPTDRVPVTELLLFNTSNSSLKLQNVDLSLIKQDDFLLECHLSFQISLQLYKEIDTGSLFNLKRELRGSLNAVRFQQEANIEIEVALQPQLLPQLAEYASDSESTIAYLIACSQEILSTPLENLDGESESDIADESTRPHPCPNPLLSTES